MVIWWFTLSTNEKRLKVNDGCHDVMNAKEIVIKLKLALYSLFKILSPELIDDDNYPEHYYNLFFNFH